MKWYHLQVGLSSEIPTELLFVFLIFPSMRHVILTLSSLLLSP